MNPILHNDSPNTEAVVLTETAGHEQAPPQGDLPARLIRALGPILPGMILDSLDLVTFGPIGLLVGIIVGGLAGYWLSTEYRLSPTKRLMGALAAGFYCMLPFTSFLPVGTLIGVYFRFHEQPGGNRQNTCTAAGRRRRVRL